MRPTWSDVFRNFRARHRGCDPERLPSETWLQLAATADDDGSHGQAEVYLDAGIVMAAYEADIYTPPADLCQRYIAATA